MTKKYKNIKWFLICLVVILIPFNVSAKAKVIDINHVDVVRLSTASNQNDKKNNFLNETELNEIDCNGIFTPDALNLIREILGYFQILGPVVLIVMTSIDLGRAVMGSDDKEFSKSTSRIFKRILATLGLFLVPAMVRALLGVDGIKNVLTTKNDPLCLSATGTNSSGGQNDYWDEENKENNISEDEEEENARARQYCVYSLIANLYAGDMDEESLYIKSDKTTNGVFVSGSISQYLASNKLFKACPQLDFEYGSDGIIKFKIVSKGATGKLSTTKD